MADFKDRAWMNVSGTPGTGNITLGTVVAGNQSFTDAGAVDGTQYGYVVVDGNDWEEGSGTPSSSVTVFQRTTVSRSVIAGVAGTTKLTLSSAAQIYLTARAVDLQDASNIRTGTVAQARLGTGSAGAGLKALFDDQTFKPVTVNGLIQVDVFTSTQTVNIPAGATRAKVRLWGGSGGGAGIAAGIVQQGVAGAGAGYLEKYLTGLTAALTLALTIGAAGAAGASNTAGGTGGNSILASGTQAISTLTANGGTGGPKSTGLKIQPTAGGTASGGDVNITGGYSSQPQDNAMALASTPGMTGGGMSLGGLSQPTTGAGFAGAIGGCIIEWYS